jgi:predicted methyltransferase
MKRYLLAALAALSLPALAAAAPPADPLEQAVASPTRTPAFVARDRYRHPLQTLRFFGIRPDMTVVEIWPSSGWYTEILAPYLHDHGKYYAAGSALDVPDVSEETKKGAAAFQQKLAADPGRYGAVTVTAFLPPQRADICPPGSADLVVTFRNVHNWMEEDFADRAFADFFKALKPGGLLGVEEHRANAGGTQDPKAQNGYVQEAFVKALAEKAGFKFVKSSELLANPKDTKDHPFGVWTLPPTLLSTADGKSQDPNFDHSKYIAIGEADNMLLLFQKPK